MTTRRPRVYVAHSVVTYGTEHEATTLAAIVAAFPGAEIVNPAGRYRTNAGWLRAWPRLLPTLDVMVVFCDEDGCIGAGCLREIADAIRVGTDVGLFAGGRLRELRRLDLLASGDRSAWRAARPVAGRLVRLAWTGSTLRTGAPRVTGIPAIRSVSGTTSGDAARSRPSRRYR